MFFLIKLDRRDTVLIPGPRSVTPQEIGFTKLGHIKPSTEKYIAHELFRLALDQIRDAVLAFQVSCQINSKQQASVQIGQAVECELLCRP